MELEIISKLDEKRLIIIWIPIIGLLYRENNELYNQLLGIRSNGNLIYSPKNPIYSNAYGGGGFYEERYFYKCHKAIIFV
jgi:hypothetical protein